MTRSAHWRAPGLLGSSAFLLIALLGLTLLPIAASADDEEPSDIGLEEYQEEERRTWGRKGPFIGIGGLGIFANPGGLHDGVRIDSGAGAGFNVRAGIRTAPYFALEVMYEQWLNMDVSLGSASNDAKGWFWSLNGKGYLFSNTPIQPYGLVGVGAMSIDPRFISRRTGFAMRFGGGLDYYLTRNWVIDIEGSYALGIGTQIENLGYGVVSAGLAYRF